jgi:outer membrane protein assembly factor BamB
LECTQLYGSNPEDPSQWLIRKWKQRGRFGNGQVLLVGDLLLVHSEGGELMLVAADPAEYRLLGSIKTISGICWNTFGLYGKRVLVRSNEEMACFEIAVESDSVGHSDANGVE